MNFSKLLWTFINLFNSFVVWRRWSICKRRLSNVFNSIQLGHPLVGTSFVDASSSLEIPLLETSSVWNILLLGHSLFWDILFLGHPLLGASSLMSFDWVQIVAVRVIIYIISSFQFSPPLFIQVCWTSITSCEYISVPYGFPRIVESPTLKAVEKGRNTVMVCSATGDPEPSITWLKDFIPVDTSDPRLQILTTG